MSQLKFRFIPLRLQLVLPLAISTFMLFVDFMSPFRSAFIIMSLVGANQEGPSDNMGKSRQLLSII